mmetsp:Transcript_11335/g.27180  ORF Transcript_11335/g.27180 Transcript_11335/m.27180 type:complete len:144 (+) Transcript_11335:121-552(+)|eukprot:CAMPEP_0197173276 /NCGR_PEP_ID=MMETSP1423-20130617/275_1 /TAXON_ID=476441 /ORGANISM="Pseudo-nitzschia heimii, Strain UNC1101" /LENGTH=143 /DNA_ID=CAMNT_0042622071 /DNA_START=86 /DNA_END=517 /DNA_ORIENTATION=+
MSTFKKFCVLFLATISCVESLTSKTSRPLHGTALAATNTIDDSRRNALKKVATVTFAVAFAPAVAANALDMDAFANAQIEADIKNCDPKLDPKCIPKLNADEALCKYGQSGTKKSEACKRVKAAGGDVSQAPQGKSLGGAYAM